MIWVEQKGLLVDVSRGSSDDEAGQEAATRNLG